MRRITLTDGVPTVDRLLTERMNRRSALKVMAGAGAAALVGTRWPAGASAAGWGAWQDHALPMPEVTYSMAAASVPAAGGGLHLEVFAVSRYPVGHETLMRCTYNGTWQRLPDLPGFNYTSTPAVASVNGRLDVFCRGGDLAIWHIASSGPEYDVSWTAESRGGRFNTGPAAASWGPGRLDVVGTGQDGALYHMAYDSGRGGWSGWVRVGGALTSAPAIASWGPDRLDVFARGQDYALWHIAQDYPNNAWGAWESLGGRITSSPAVTSWAPGRLDVFARGQDNTLWHRSYDGVWSGWASLGGGSLYDPAAAPWGQGRTVVWKGNYSHADTHQHASVLWYS